MPYEKSKVTNFGRGKTLSGFEYCHRRTDMPLSPRTLVPSSSFTPRSISGLALWLDAADARYTPQEN